MQMFIFKESITIIIYWTLHMYQLAIYRLFHLIHPNFQSIRCSHLTGKETEVHRGEIVCLSLNSKPGLKDHILNLESCFKSSFVIFLHWHSFIMRGFIVLIPYCIQWTLNKFTLSILFPYFPLFQCLMGFISCLCECSVLWSSSPLSILSFPLPLLLIPQQSPFTFVSQYHHHSIISCPHKWARTCDIWLFEFGLFTQHDDLQFQPFPANDPISLFFMAE
jgi:hypothetical protein